MVRANAIDLCVAYLALVAACAVVGAVIGAASRLSRWTRHRRDIRRLEAFANHPAHRARNEDR